MGDGKLDRGQQGGVFGEVVGARTEVLALFGQNLSCSVLDIDTKSGRARVATGAAIAVCDDPPGCRKAVVRMTRAAVAVAGSIGMIWG